MSNGHYNGFDTIRIDADGIRVGLANTTFDVKALPGHTSLGTVVSDGFGYIPDGILSPAAGTVVEFSHVTYPDKFQRTLALTAEDAAALTANLPAAYVAENLYTSTREAIAAEIWAHDRDNPDAIDFLLAIGRVGEENDIPYETFVDRNYRLYLVGLTAKGERSHLEARDGDFADFLPDSWTPPEFVLRSLFAFAEDRVSAASGNTLYGGVLAENTFDTNKTIVRAVFGGHFAGNADEKRLEIYIGTHGIFDAAVEQNGGTWRIDVELVRDSSSTLRTNTRLTLTPDEPDTFNDVIAQEGAVTGLDFDDLMVVRLFGSRDADGDITAKFGYAEKLSAPSDETEYLGGDGLFLTGGGAFLTS